MSENRLISTEPATGATLWTGAYGDVDAEVSAARGAWASWASRPLTVRVETLRRFANVVRKKTAKFADIIARETGKPLWEATTEVEAVINKVEISIAAYSERTAHRKLEGALGARVAVRHKPHGVLAVLGPYNFPAHLPNGHIVPALLAGNAVVFKPSEKTPATGEHLVSLFHEAGIPKDVLRCLIGGPETGKALAAHPGIDGLLFTGSARAGMSLHRQFAETPDKILALELGGNNPLIVWDARDLYAAAVIAVQSAFLTAGQRCTAARRLIVKDGAHTELIANICSIAERLIISTPHSAPPPFMGPVIDNGAADQLEEGFLDLMLKGGRPIKHLDRPLKDLPFLTPAIIDVTDVDNRPDAELFGPILQVIRVPDFESALAEANATRYGLAASLVGGTSQLYDRFWANIRAGVVNWNRPTNGAPSNAPFGGVGASGNHRPSAYYAADYCAYPVTSSESDHVRASIGIGLAEASFEMAPKLRRGADPTPAAAPLERAATAGMKSTVDLDASRPGMGPLPQSLEATLDPAMEKSVAPEPGTAGERADPSSGGAEAPETIGGAGASPPETEQVDETAEEAAAEEARLAEEAAEAAAAEEARLAAEAAAAEEARVAAEAAAAEEARLAAEAAAAEEERLAAEAAVAEEARRAAEAEEARLAAEAATAEEARLAAEAAAAEQARLEAEAAAAEEARLAAEAAAAEEARLAAEAAAAEEARLAAEAAAAEEARRAAEAAAAEEARRAAEAAAAEEAKHVAEAAAAEEARRAAEAAAAEETRRAEEAAAAEKARLAAEAAAAEEAKRADEAAQAQPPVEEPITPEPEPQPPVEAKPSTPEPRVSSSRPVSPVVPMVDGRAARLEEEAELERARLKLKPAAKKK